jgi:hypothetical protein
MHTGSGWGNVKERDPLEDLDVDGILFKCILNSMGEGDGVGNPAQDSDKLRALVNTVMNLRVPYNSMQFLSS